MHTHALGHSDRDRHGHTEKEQLKVSRIFIYAANSFAEFQELWMYVQRPDEMMGIWSSTCTLYFLCTWDTRRRILFLGEEVNL